MSRVHKTKQLLRKTSNLRLSGLQHVTKAIARKCPTNDFSYIRKRITFRVFCSGFLDFSEQLYFIGHVWMAASESAPANLNPRLERCFQNPVKYLRWSFLRKIVNSWKPQFALWVDGLGFFSRYFCLQWKLKTQNRTQVFRRE